mgnify:CR=1 FL=1
MSASFITTDIALAPALPSRYASQSRARATTPLLRLLLPLAGLALILHVQAFQPRVQQQQRWQQQQQQQQATEFADAAEDFDDGAAAAAAARQPERASSAVCPPPPPR